MNIFCAESEALHFEDTPLAVRGYVIMHPWRRMPITWETVTNISGFICGCFANHLKSPDSTVLAVPEYLYDCFISTASYCSEICYSLYIFSYKKNFSVQMESTKSIHLRRILPFVKSSAKETDIQVSKAKWTAMPLRNLPCLFNITFDQCL